MTRLAVRDLSVVLGGREILHTVALDVDDGETVAVLGPSGSGKTTLLRAIAGLEAPTSGRVTWDGHDLARVPPHERGFGLMFQDHALFLHRDVAGNVAYGLERAHVPKADRWKRVDALLETVGLPGFGRRAIDSLSGGEQQRVALARALAPSPRLLLFDEPFGALDRLRREQLVADVRALLDHDRVPAIVVTHDHDEAFALAHRVAVMRDGRIVQVAAPDQLWSAPADEWTARFVGHGDVVDGVVRDGVVDTAWGSLPAPSARAAGPVRVVLRADALSIVADGPLCGVVERSEFRGGRHVVTVALGDGPPVRVTTATGPPPVGARVRLACAPDAVLVYAG